jgi:hypothetical protein
VASATLTWDYCDGNVAQGSRQLAEAELESLASGLGSVRRMSTTDRCLEGYPTYTIAITRDGEANRFEDQQTACGREGVYAECLRGLMDGLKALCVTEL